MDSRTGGQGPYERPYYGDPNILRQQMAGYGMHQHPYTIPQQHLQPDGFQRRQAHDIHSMSHANTRVNNLTSPPQSSNPWFHSFPGQQSVMNSDYPINMSNMFPSRWEQDQQTSFLQQHNSSYSLNSKIQENHLQRERELQMQREREEQAQLLYRERHVQQLQQEREAQIQRDRELQLQKEKEREQIQREKEAQLQREREADLQRKRESQLQREREAQLHRERELQFQHDRENQLLREREAQLEREKKAMFHSYFTTQQQQTQQFQSFYPSPQTSMSNLNFTQSENTLQQQQEPYFNHQNNTNSLSLHRSNVQSTSMLGNYSVQQMFSPNKMPTPDHTSSKSSFSSSSLLHFPQSSPVTTTTALQWSSPNTTNIPRKSSSSSFDNSVINSIVSDKGFLTSPLDSQFMKNWTDIADMDLNEIEKNVLGPKGKEDDKPNASDQSLLTKIGDNNGQVVKLDSAVEGMHNLNLPPEHLLDFNKISIDEQKDANFLTDTLYNQSHSGIVNHNTTSISQTKSLQVSQNNSVNINININMSSSSSTIPEMSEAVISEAKSTLASALPSIDDYQPIRQNCEIKESQTTPTVPVTASSDRAHRDTDDTTQVQKPKSKQSYSSIESFLGMSNDNDEKPDKKEALFGEEKVKTTNNIPDKQDRISVIKPLPVMPKEPVMSKNIMADSNGHLSHDGDTSPPNEKFKIDKENKINVPKETVKRQTKSARPLHPSMRMKKQKPPPVTISKAATPTQSDIKDKSATPAKLLHPSMRLASNTKCSEAVNKAGDNLDDSFERKANILHTPKAVRYQSERKCQSDDKPNSLSLKSPPPATVSSTIKLVHSGKPVHGGKPIHSGKPFHSGKPIHGGKPVSYSVCGGGKPASYSSQVRKDSPPGGKPTTGKPLSYLKSVMESTKSATDEIKETKSSAGKKRTRKEAYSKSTKKVNEKASTPPKPKSMQAPTEKQTKSTGKSKTPTVAAKNPINKTPVNQPKKDNSASKAIKPVVPPKPETEDLIVPRHKKVESSPEKPFKFKDITFDAKKDEESSESDTDSSSDSDSDGSNDSPSDSDDGSEGSGDESKPQTSSPSPKKRQTAGQKRKAVPDNSEVIANLKKRKIVDEEVIKIPLESGWRRQTRLRPSNTGDGLRGDVYYYSPCGKKLRTYPELNTYIFRNEVKDVELKHFSFSTKLRVGEFLEAKQGSKFDKLTEEQITERFEMMAEKSRMNREKAEERSKKKKEKEEKQKKALEEKKMKQIELQEKKRQKEEDRRKALKEKALETKMKKEKEKEAAKEAKRLKEEAIMLKKLEKKAQLEANRIAKREKVQNMLAEKKRMKEQKEHERLMKIEQQRMRQQAIEDEKERKRQQHVISKVHEKEKRKREMVMMKAYEAQRKAEERERLKEQKRLEKTLIRQRKLEQKRYERLISKELKKPIDDMALTDLKPLPNLPQIVNMNIPGKAYADLLMVEEFVHAFGHVLEIDTEKEFPSMAELQSSLLCESGSEDALFTACQALLFYALYDPGVSGPHSKTSLGVDITSVELNESNLSEVLRLFILSRNEGKPHELSDALAKYPLEALSAINKAAVLAFIVNELLCGKAIGREIDGSLENISNMRRDKWNLEGDIRKLKADITSKKPKQNNESPEKKNKETAPTKDSDNESDNEENQDVTAGPNDTLDEVEPDTSELDDPKTVEQMEKKLKFMEKKHVRFRKKLFDSSHAIRGIHLGQDRFKRRYFVLPNAGGIYVEGLESGFFDEEIGKTEEEKEERKEHLDNLLTSLKSPNALKTEQNVAFNMLPDSKNNITSQDTQKLKSPNYMASENLPFKEKNKISWFPLHVKQQCDSPKTPIVVSSNEKQIVTIIAPNFKQLGDDRQFLESIYSCYNSSSSFIPGGLLPNTGFPISRENMNRNALLGLPPELDLNLLIQQDPQKAAEILEIQTAVPNQIPEDMKKGWWRITDPEEMQKVNKCAHIRGMRERNLQKTVARVQEYTNSSCKINHPAFSLLLPDEECEMKDQKDESTAHEGKDNERWYPQLAYASDKAMLMEVEELEEKVFSASLQVKGWRLSQKISPTLQLNAGSGDQNLYNPTEEDHPIHIAATRLLALEAGIERRYLKPPFRSDSDSNKDDSLKNSNVQSIVTPALSKWRQAVSASKSASQLSMCVNTLFDSVAWEKSIMKVFCILCRKSDNEERLLLCDACDRGCHTYCCKPKLDTIPDGDWFCQECILMASGSDQCYKCKGKSGKRLKCGFCPRHYHMQCLEPPLHKTPRSPWACPVCKKTRSKSKPPPKKKPRAEEVLKKEEEQQKSKQSNNRTQTFKDMEPCRAMLADLENHESAWPFLVPVNIKQFPEYYKVIKHPMDFHTMKMKLRDYQYKGKEEFARDARLVFFNCKTYNEDESDVGRAGETMRLFFEKRWPQVKKNAPSTPSFSAQKKAQHEQYKENDRDSDGEDDSDDGEESSSSSEEISSESESSEVEEESDVEGSQ